MESTITTLNGGRPGPTLAIFAGVHGNEPVGVMAIESVAKELQIKFGTIHLVIANPKAVEKKVRYIEKNLNRCFVKDNTGDKYEDRLASDLMKLLDNCDAVLDIHGYNGDEDTPFLICENESFELAKLLDFEIISHGWSRAEPGGTDGYMHSLNKIAICAETGSNLYPEKYLPLAMKTIQQFLQFFGVIETVVDYSARPQKYIRVTESVLRTSKDFSFNKLYQNFDPITAGEIYAHDGAKKYIAKENQCLIFPRENAEVGQEAFVIGEVS